VKKQSLQVTACQYLSPSMSLDTGQHCILQSNVCAATSSSSVILSPHHVLTDIPRHPGGHNDAVCHSSLPAAANSLAASILVLQPCRLGSRHPESQIQVNVHAEMDHAGSHAYN